MLLPYRSHASVELQLRWPHRTVDFLRVLQHWSTFMVIRPTKCTPDSKAWYLIFPTPGGWDFLIAELRKISRRLPKRPLRNLMKFGRKLFNIISWILLRKEKEFHTTRNCKPCCPSLGDKFRS